MHSRLQFCKKSNISDNKELTEIFTNETKFSIYFIYHCFLKLNKMGHKILKSVREKYEDKAAMCIIISYSLTK